MSARLEWQGGSATLESLGGMLSPLQLSLPDGRRVEPLAVAPWVGEALPGAPPLLRSLRGSFPCLPFGTGEEGQLAQRWAGVAHDLVDPPHGAPANGLWDVWVEGGVLRGQFAPAPDEQIALVEQDVRPDGPAGVACRLTATARRVCRLPIAIHPIFKLSAITGGTKVDLHSHGPIFTHPSFSLTDPCPLMPDTIADGLDALPARDGGTLDFLQLPRSTPSESRVLVTHSGGRVSLHHKEGWTAHLVWDTSVLPSAMLWISNGGRSRPPWNGRHFGLGIEPCAAAFDLGTAASAGENPLSAAHVQTAVLLEPDQPLVVHYRISVSAS